MALRRSAEERAGGGNETSTNSECRKNWTKMKKQYLHFSDRRETPTRGEDDDDRLRFLNETMTLSYSWLEAFFLTLFRYLFFFYLLHSLESLTREWLPLNCQSYHSRRVLYAIKARVTETMKFTRVHTLFQRFVVDSFVPVEICTDHRKKTIAPEDSSVLAFDHDIFAFWQRPRERNDAQGFGRLEHKKNHALLAFINYSYSVYRPTSRPEISGKIIVPRAHEQINQSFQSTANPWFHGYGSVFRWPCFSVRMPPPDAHDTHYLPDARSAVLSVTIGELPTEFCR